MGAPPSLHPSDRTLSSYGLGKLDDGAARAVDEHLGECPDCRDRVAGMSADSFLSRVRDARKGSETPTPGRVQPLGTQSYLGPNSPAPPPADTLPPGLADHPDYEIRRELGRGGMGVVYLAHNTLMGRDEVLKVMGRQIMERPGVLDRFLREIRAVARLRHPNIVTAYHAARLGESIVFAMEYVEGLDLSKMVKAKGPLPVAHACNFAYQSAQGLQHAHEEGLVHRDIKPGNLMLSRKGEKAAVKVLDFGLAKATREERVDGALTSQGQALGTPDFIAPEQILDAQGADVRADIYSLGGTLYYLLTGRPPFRANSLYDIYQAHISRDADPLNLVRPEVPSELAALVAKMMAKDPSRRFQTPGEVAEALAPFFRKGSVAFRSPQADVVRSVETDAGRSVSGGVSSPTEPATDAGGPVVRPKKAVESTVPEGRWESLIDLKETDSLFEMGTPVAPARRPPWVWPSLAVGVLMFGFLAAWLGGVFRVKTPDGVIVLENVPRDAEILVDGQKITFLWPGLGHPLEIRAVPGQRKVEVKRDGFKTFGEVVTVKAEGSEEVTVRLEPLVAAGPGKKEAEAPGAERDGEPEPPRPAAEGAWVPLFNGKDLNGWEDRRPGAGDWTVAEGILEGRGSGQKGDVPLLVTERRTFANFRLRVTCRFPRQGGGGTCVRYASADDVARAYLVSDKGGVLELRGFRRGDDWPKQPLVQHAVPTDLGDWHVLEVEAVGNTIRTSLNGERVTEYRDDEDVFAAGGITLNCGPYSTMQIQKVMIEELPASTDTGGSSVGAGEAGRPTEGELPATPAAFPDSVKNSLGMTLKLNPAGEFFMGIGDDPETVKSLYPWPEIGKARPRHKVRITRPFYIGACEVTQEQYERVTGKNPSIHGGSPRLPVDGVNWLDAVSFCNRLSALEKRPPYYKISGGTVSTLGGDGYRLPTEAEWESACRAGSQWVFPHGNDWQDNLSRAWMNYNSKKTTHPVGELTPNRLGLYDMLGNVSEWCWDWAGPYKDDGGVTVDPAGPPQGDAHIARGGCFNWNTTLIFTAWHREFVRDYSKNPGHYGFRVAFSAVGPGSLPAGPGAAGTSAAGEAPVGLVIYKDDFSDPASGWKRTDTDQGPGLRPFRRGYEKGIYFLEAPESWQGAEAWNCTNDLENEYQCEATGRVIGVGDARGAWGLIVIGPDKRGFQVEIDRRSKLSISPAFWGVEMHPEDPTFPPIAHPAIKPGSQWNTLTLRVARHRLEVLVNGKAVRAPIPFDWDILPGKPQIAVFKPEQDTLVRAEFDRVEVRQLRPISDAKVSPQGDGSGERRD